MSEDEARKFVSDLERFVTAVVRRDSPNAQGHREKKDAVDRTRETLVQALVSKEGT